MNAFIEFIQDALTYSKTDDFKNTEKFFDEISHAHDKRWLGCSLKLFLEWINKQFEDEMDFNNFGDKWELYHILPKSHFPHEKHYWNFHNILVVSQSQKETLDDNLDNYEIYYSHVSNAEKFYIEHVKMIF